MNVTETRFVLEMPDTGNVLHCRVHQHEDGEMVLSIDLLRHMEELPMASPDLLTPPSPPVVVEAATSPLKKAPRRVQEVDELDILLQKPRARRRKSPNEPCPGERPARVRKYKRHKKLEDTPGAETVEAPETVGEKLEQQEDLPEAPASPTPDEPVAVSLAVPLAVPKECKTSRISRVHHQSDTDQQIFDLVRERGCRWREIARIMGGRGAGFNDDVIRNRYIRCMEALGTPYQTTHARRGPSRKPSGPSERWCDEEDQIIWTCMLQLGPSWDTIADRLPGRTAQAVRNRANRVGLVESMNHWIRAAQTVAIEVSRPR
jgi:hypothetical protein